MMECNDQLRLSACLSVSPYTCPPVRALHCYFTYIRYCKYAIKFRKVNCNANDIRQFNHREFGISCVVPYSDCWTERDAFYCTSSLLCCKLKDLTVISVLGLTLGSWQQQKTTIVNVIRHIPNLYSLGAKQSVRKMPSMCTFLSQNPAMWDTGLVCCENCATGLLLYHTLTTREVMNFC